MKTLIYILIAASALALTGCATNDEYEDDQEYSNMPWNTPQQYEGSRSVPGLGGGGGGQTITSSFAQEKTEMLMPSTNNTVNLLREFMILKVITFNSL